MKKYRVVFFGLMLSFAVLAEEPQVVTVTGDRVSLRAAPQRNAVLLDRATTGDQLVLADNSNSKWVGVRPPQKIDFWVNSEYVQDDVVLPARLNVRSGPSLSHGVVGVVARDEKLTVRGTLDGWVRIAPPEKAVVWISRAYTDIFPPKSSDVDEPILVTGTEAPPAESESKIVITVESPKPNVQEAEKEIVREVMKDLLIAAVEVVELPEVLEPDTEKEQGVEEKFSGILQPANAILYKLVDPILESTVVCYVRGNTKQMEAYAGRSLTLTGRTYWAAGLEQPFLVPEKIEVLKK